MYKLVCSRCWASVIAQLAWQSVRALSELSCLFLLLLPSMLAAPLSKVTRSRVSKLPKSRVYHSPLFPYKWCPPPHCTMSVHWPRGPCPFHPPNPGKSLSEPLQPLPEPLSLPCSSYSLLDSDSGTLSKFCSFLFVCFCAYSFPAGSAKLPCLSGLSLPFSECLDTQEVPSFFILYFLESSQTTGQSRTAFPQVHSIQSKTVVSKPALPPASCVFPGTLVSLCLIVPSVKGRWNSPHLVE